MVDQDALSYLWFDDRWLVPLFNLMTLVVPKKLYLVTSGVLWRWKTDSEDRIERILVRIERILVKKVFSVIHLATLKNRSVCTWSDRDIQSSTESRNLVLEYLIWSFQKLKKMMIGCGRQFVQAEISEKNSEILLWYQVNLRKEKVLEWMSCLIMRIDWNYIAFDFPIYGYKLESYNRMKRIF